MDPGNKVCRVCLGCCPQEYYSIAHGTPSYQFKLQECVPFMDLKMILDPIICVTCAAMLDRSYQLVIVARNVESRLFGHLKSISCIGTYYIMAEKPNGGALEHLNYHTVADDAYNFRMVVAMAAKTEVAEDCRRLPIETNAGGGGVVHLNPSEEMIKVENVDRDYDENERMPNIDLMIETPNFAPDSAISNCDPPIDQHTVLSILIDANTPETANNASKSSKLSPNNAVLLSDKSKSGSYHHCPVCNGSFSNLPSHMRVHFDRNRRKANAMSDDVWGILTSLSHPPIICLQCGCDYLLDEGHKCLFSSYVRLERLASLDSMATTVTDPQLSMHHQKNGMNQSGEQYIAHIGDNSSDDDITCFNDDGKINDDSTLTALSVYDDAGATVAAAAAEKLERRQTCECAHCPLRFDNSVQLKRHLFLRHTCVDGIYENHEESSPILSIQDEHSYAKLKSIQCWNCPQTFIIREDWLKHDYCYHKTNVFICYICFRGYKHSQIISHITTTHSLRMDENDFIRMLTSRQYFPKPLTPSRLDDTFSRMSTFIMHEYKLIHCPLCRKSCASSSLLIRHLVLNKCTISKCTLCQMDLESSLHLLQHLMTVLHRRKTIDKVTERYLWCQICDAVFTVEIAFINHMCHDECNPYILYRQKMGLWECSVCLIMGIAGKQQHILSAVHLKRKLEQLLSATSTVGDLHCHLCLLDEPYANKSMLFEHLLRLHVETLTVLCPLCHFMTLNPDQYTNHLQLVHPNFVNRSLSGLAKPNAPNKYCPDEFTCLLCKRQHWTLNSFWETCGRGHKQSFSLEVTLQYLSMFNEQKWLHFNGDSYTCECGRKLQNSSYLYKHYKCLLNYENDFAVGGGCSVWICCDLCSALISPPSKLDHHKEIEHFDSLKRTPQQFNIRCKNHSELFEQKCTANEALGKRKERKTPEENGRLVIDEEHRKKKQRLITADNVEINLSEVNRINDPRMQPILRLEKLPYQSTIVKPSMSAIAVLHMVEAIERVVADDFNNDLVGHCNDGDDRSSCCSSDLLQLEDPLALDDVLSTNNQIDDKNSLIIEKVLPVPFIEPKDEQLHIINNDNSENSSFSFPVEILFDSNEDDSNCISELDIDDLLINEKNRKKDGEEIKCELIIKESDVVDDTTNNYIIESIYEDKQCNVEAIPNEPIKIMYKCDRCHLLTASRTDLAVHSCRLSKIDIVRCAFCEKDFLNTTKLHAHMLHEHSTFGRLGRVPRIDGINGSTAVDSRETSVPVVQRDGAENVASSSDGQVVSVVSQSGITQKVKQGGPTTTRKQIKCSLCQQLFENMKILIVHMKTNHFPSICIHCDDKFANSDNLNRHLEMCHSALRNRELNRIMFNQTATENTNNTSDIHNDDSSHPDTTAIHYNIFRCLDCQLLLPGFYAAKEHFSTAHIDAAGDVYSCQMCDTFAVDRQLMKQHKALHKDGSFKCIVCEDVFKNFVDYKVHYNDHKMASCPHCPHMFLDMYELRAHIADRHGGATKMK